MKILIENTNIPEQDFWVDENGNPVPEDPDRYFLRKLRVEEDTYSPVAGENDMTTLDNWVKYFTLRQHDYIWEQRRIREVFDAAVGATDVDKWNTFSNAEKDIILQYNQFKGESGGAEDNAKVTYLLTTGKVGSVPEAVDWLKRTHSSSVSKGKEAALKRMAPDSDGVEKLSYIIISYLNPVDTTDMLATIELILNWFKQYYIRGTIDPGNPSGIYDYINSTGDFTVNGLISEGYTTINGKPLSDLIIELNDLLFGDNEL
jgi:hypothetical protein